MLVSDLALRSGAPCLARPLVSVVPRDGSVLNICSGANVFVTGVVAILEQKSVLFLFESNFQQSI